MPIAIDVQLAENSVGLAWLGLAWLGSVGCCAVRLLCCKSCKLRWLSARCISISAVPAKSNKLCRGICLTFSLFHCL